MRLSVLAIILLLSAECFSQSFYNARRSRDVIVSVGTGVSSYFGDLNDPGDIIDTDLNLNLGGQYMFNDRIAARAEFTWFRVSGDDAQSEDEERLSRNLSFSSSNFEFNIVGIVNAFQYGPRFYQRPEFNVYGLAGIGGLYFNPKAELNGEKYALQPLQTEGTSYSQFAFTLVYGAGVKYMINPFINVAIEAGYRQTFTDYLDDVSTNYIDNSSFSSPIAASLADRGPEIGNPLRSAGRVRGNSDRNDGYLLFNFKLEFYLPPNIFTFNSGKNRRGPGHNIKRRRRR